MQTSTKKIKGGSHIFLYEKYDINFENELYLPPVKIVTNDYKCQTRLEKMCNENVINSVLFANDRIRIHRDVEVFRTMRFLEYLTTELIELRIGDESFPLTHFYWKYYEIIETQTTFLLAKIAENSPIGEDNPNIAAGLVVDYIGLAYVSIEKLLDEIIFSAKCEYNFLMAEFSPSINGENSADSEDGMPGLMDPNKRHHKRRNRNRGRGRRKRNEI